MNSVNRKSAVTHFRRPGHAGTASAVAVERQLSLLGLRLDADKLHVSPRLPADWNSFQVHYRYRQTIHHITVLQTSAANGEPRLTVDGALLPGQAVPLVDDSREHLVEVRIPPAQG